MSSELRRHNVRADQKALRVLAIGMFIASLLLLVATTSLAGTSAETSRYLSKLIVVGQGVSGVRLGDSPKRVTAILGKPASTQPPYWTYRSEERRVARKGRA